MSLCLPVIYVAILEQFTRNFTLLFLQAFTHTHTLKHFQTFNDYRGKTLLRNNVALLKSASGGVLDKKLIYCHGKKN